MDFESEVVARASRDAEKICYAFGWAVDELYDINPEHKEVAQKMHGELFELLKKTDGMCIRLQPDRGGVNNLRRKGGAKPADFPPQFYRDTR